MDVHILHAPSAEGLAHLRTLLDEGIAITLGPETPSPAAYAVLVAGRPAQEHLEASPNLRALIIPWAGLPGDTRALLSGYAHISVHNLHHNAPQTAEMALALLFAAAKKLVPVDRRLRTGDWSSRYGPVPSVLLAGKTALILGLGSIGRRVAQVCSALGMQVLATRRNPVCPPDIRAKVHPPQALHDLLPHANALFVTLPLTEQTKGLIGERELSLLPPEALLINVGRGPIVEEEALYEALKSGHLAGAGIDVWYNYPKDADAHTHTLPSNYPLHELDNIVMSPHRGGNSGKREAMRMAQLATLLNAAARGETIPNRVDLEAGY